MKRTLRLTVPALFAALVLAGCLAGCSSNGDQAASDQQGAAQDVAASTRGAAEPAAEQADADAGEGSRPAAASAEDEPSADSAPKVATHGTLGTFEAETLDGGTFTQDDLARTDVTMFDFWSTGCSPCVNEMSSLAALSERLPDNVRIVTVCLDGAYNAERAASIMENAGFDGVTLVGGTGGILDLMYAVQYTPTKVFATGDGVLMGDAIVGGQKNFEDLFLSSVNAILEQEGKEGITLG